MDFLANDVVLILCALAGSGLLVLEAFMPGFGVAGFFGIVLDVLAVYSAWAYHGTTFALIATILILLVVTAVIWIAYRSAMKGRLSKGPLVLKDAESAENEKAANTLSAFVGQQAVTVTSLRPAGTVEVNGQRLAASSGSDFIERGKPVRITGTEGDHVVVQLV